MEIVCRCTNCSAKFKIDEKYAGRKARCPKCQTVVEVPTANASDSSASPTVGPPKTTAALQRPATSNPPAAASQPSVSEFAGLTLNTTKPAKTAKKTAADSTQTTKRKSIPIPIVAAAGIGVLLLVGGSLTAFLLFRGDGPQATAAKAKSATARATLVLDWPAEQRGNAMLAIDGKTLRIPATGEMQFPLKPGSHSLVLRRRGYEPIDESLLLAQGEQKVFTPNWKQPAVASVPSVASKAAVPASDSDTPFAIGTGVTSNVKGFDGWLQDLEAAKQQASAEQKDLLMVFGCSDAAKTTRELAAALKTADVQALVAERYVPVVIDFPRTREGYNQVFDHAQNQHLAEQYRIREFPALLLADQDARPFAIEQEWKDGIGDLKALLESKLSQRAERDSLLSDAAVGDDQGRIAAAEKALQWLRDKKIAGAFEPEVSQWLALAEKVDADNVAGKIEPFFEFQWTLNLFDMDADDEFSLRAAVAAMRPWVQKRKFIDPDRGARMHLMAASLLMRMEKQDEAVVHLTRATSYEPKDKDLKEAVSGAKIALQNKDVLSTGTGFVISAAGYILTNHHVVEGEGKVVVRIPQTKETIAAEIVAQDADRDMALLKVTFPETFKPGVVPVAAVESGRGADIAAFGFPLGDSIGSGLKLTTGVVSAVPDESENNMILLDLRVNPGNSGGPLCDKRGNVIGMITAKTGGIGVDSYGMAIPAADLIKFLDANLPSTAPRASATGDDAAKAWSEVDKLVSPGVLMILKTK